MPRNASSRSCLPPIGAPMDGANGLSGYGMAYPKPSPTMEVPLCKKTKRASALLYTLPVAPSAAPREFARHPHLAAPAAIGQPPRSPAASVRRYRLAATGAVRRPTPVLG